MVGVGTRSNLPSSDIKRVAGVEGRLHLCKNNIDYLKYVIWGYLPLITCAFVTCGSFPESARLNLAESGDI